MVLTYLCTFGKYQDSNGWPSSLWQACWNAQAEWLDFICDEWVRLPHKKQVRYAKAYQAWYAARIIVPVEKRFPLGNTEVVMVLIPQGKFWMGSLREETEHPYAYSAIAWDEIRHRVILPKPYWIGKTAVTQGQWQAVMGNTPSFFGNVEAKAPVENVSWNDCQAFCQKTGQGLRLPTEAEWEYACRAGTTARFNLGENITTAHVNCIMDYGSGSNYTMECRETTVPVGSLPNANAWGAYDFHGNVWEWCSDWYGDYAGDDVVNPMGAVDGKYRIVRGGSWRTHAFGSLSVQGDSWCYNCTSCRSASRKVSYTGNGDSEIGLRLARTFP